jgi:hypothetical protein
MVIIVSREGQLANRIAHASSFMVNAQEHGYRVVHLFFDDYYSFFSECLSDKKTPIKFLGKRRNGLVVSFQKFVTVGVKVFLKLGITKLPFFEIVRYEGYQQDMKAFDLNDEKFIKKARSKLVLVQGWLFRDPENFKKHRQLLLDAWVPNKHYRENVEQYFNKYKNRNEILIGVHLRGGDYKNFEGGKWYYTAGQYYEKMKEVASLEIFRNKKIAFVVCTNEKEISLPAADNFSVFNEERHFIEDMYLLTKCDYIIGPPSTFSMWASFYGSRPLYMIREIETKITDEIFKTKAETL